MPKFKKILGKVAKSAVKGAKKAIGGNPVPSIRQVVRAAKRVTPVVGILKTTKALNKSKSAVRPRKR